MSILDKMVVVLIIILLGAVVSFMFGFYTISLALFMLFIISCLFTIAFTMIKLMK